MSVDVMFCGSFTIYVCPPVALAQSVTVSAVLALTFLSKALDYILNDGNLLVNGKHRRHVLNQVIM